MEILPGVDPEVAVIDLGTNTFHLLIAQRTEGRYRIVARERAAARIGVGGINDGIITEEAILRSVDAVGRFAEEVRRRSIRTVHAFGTSAFRHAQNAIDVVRTIQEKTGITIRVLTGEEEATLIYEGVRSAGVLGPETTLVVDIGGGSIEFIIANGAGIFWKRSFEIGGQRLLERFQRHDPIDPSEIRAITAYLNKELGPLLVAVSNFSPTVLAGASGTFDTLSEIYCRKEGIAWTGDAAETPLTIASIYETFEQLAARNRAQRLQIPGMIEMRVDMIVVTCCVVKFLLDHCEFDTVRVSAYSLKEGVLAKLNA